MTDKLLAAYTSRQHQFFQDHEEQLRHLAVMGQAPEVLFIGCADSRVTPDKLFDLAPGEWFMLRNVANIVPPYWQTELSTAAVLEFAVLELQVKHIVICGHTDCGGIAALLDTPDSSRQPGLARWVDIARSLRSTVPANQDQAAHLRTLTERNVVLQLDHLRSYPYIRTAEQAGRLTLHGWLYDLARPAVLAYDSESDMFA